MLKLLSVRVMSSLRGEPAFFGVNSMDRSHVTPGFRLAPSAQRLASLLFAEKWAGKPTVVRLKGRLPRFTTCRVLGPSVVSVEPTEVEAAKLTEGGSA